MEFSLTTELNSALPKEIGFNFDQLKKEIEERLQKYSGLVVTADAIAPAKKERAELNKLKTAIEDERKAIKKTWNAPYAVFEAKVKEITALIQEPIGAIDGQIKKFSEQEKADKYAAIEAHYYDEIEDMAEILPLSKILPQKWENAGASVKSILSEITNSIKKAKNDIKVIRAMGLPCEENMIDVYLKTLDMGAALSEKTRLENQRAALLKANIQPPGKPAQPPTKGPTTQPPQQAIKEQTKDIRVIFRSTTKAFRHRLKDLTQEFNVEYGGI